MTAPRRLIVNADDFGQSFGVNRGIIASHERGVVTSTSLMVRWPAAVEAAAYARAHPALAVGLHLDFGEWTCRNGEWVRLYQVVPDHDPEAAAAEVERQLIAFRELVGRNPTHIDSHQHAHTDEPVRSPAVGAARRLGVPLRHLAPAVRYFGGFYGQGDDGTAYPDLIGAAALVEILRKLPTGVTELGCHPGEADGLDSMYVTERAVEVMTLCDPQVRAVLTEEGIELCSFADLSDATDDGRGNPFLTEYRSA